MARTSTSRASGLIFRVHIIESVEAEQPTGDLARVFDGERTRRGLHPCAEGVLVPAVVENDTFDHVFALFSKVDEYDPLVGVLGLDLLPAQLVGHGGPPGGPRRPP